MQPRSAQQRLTRRDFIRRAGALGLSAPAIGALLAACGTPAATSPAATVGAASTQVAPTVMAAATQVASGGAMPTVAAAATQVAGSGAVPTVAAMATQAAPTIAAVATQAAGGPSASPPTGSPGASSGAGTRTGVTDTEIVVGSWGPQSGPAAAYGAIDRTLAGYFKMVNEQGGINGRQVKFVYEDDGYQPSRTQQVVKKLAEDDKVFCFVSGLGTPNNLAVMDYLVQNNIPHIAPATGSSAMSKPLKKNVFALQTNYIVEATLITRYGLDTLGSKKFAVFYQNDAFGKEGFDSVNAELKKRGIPEAAGVTYETSDTNFSAQALKLQTTGADTLVIWAVPKPGASILVEIQKIGFTPKLLASAVINDPSLFQLAGTAVEGLYAGSWLPEYTDTSNPKIADFQAFMKKYLPNEQIGGFALSGYVEGQLATEGLYRAGKDLTREGLINAMEQLTDWTGSAVPKISYSPTNHQGANAIYFQQARQNKWVKVTDFIQYTP